MPKDIPFELVNRVMTKRAIEELVDTCFRMAGGKNTVILADRMRTLGFKYSTKAGISISIDDMSIPHKKKELLQKAQDEVVKVQNQYSQGLITDGERYNKVIDIWARTSDEVAQEMMRDISYEEVMDKEGNVKRGTSSNPIYMMIDSGARGSQTQVRQLPPQLARQPRDRPHHFLPQRHRHERPHRTHRRSPRRATGPARAARRRGCRTAATRDSSRRTSDNCAPAAPADP
jgi:DNA-directed RNA polymerase beta' subunit